MIMPDAETKFRFMDWEKPLFVIRNGKYRPLEQCLIEYVDLNQSHLFTPISMDKPLNAV